MPTSKQPPLTAETLYDNALSKALSEAMRGLLGEEAPARPEAAREYVAGAFRWIEEIMRTCEQLAFITLYIQDFRPDERHKALHLSEHEHVRFFLEVFFIKSCSAYEKCLHLLNHLYRVGQKENRLSYKKILDRVGEPVRDRVDAMWELVRQSSERRNEVVHRRHFSDTDLDALGALGLMADVREDVTFRLGYGLLAGDYREKALEHCEAANEELFTAIRDLLGACAPACAAALDEFSRA